MRNNFDAALERYQQAEQNFNYADSDSVDAAIYGLKVAEEALKVEAHKKRAATKAANKKDSTFILPWLVDKCQTENGGRLNEYKTQKPSL